MLDAGQVTETGFERLKNALPSLVVLVIPPTGNQRMHERAADD